ncbi:MAG: hypothetical protein GY730_05315 [bacterium]|nr:hypothetical protein [bacterium]
MIKNGIFRSIALSALIMVSGCATIPQESVTLNKEVTAGITLLHESNIRFINQYFEGKVSEIDNLEKEAIDNFFNQIAAATTKASAPPLGAQDLYRIKGKVEEIYSEGAKFKKQLYASKSLIIEKLQAEYNLLISANSSITVILQSAVDIDKAKNDSLSKVADLSNGRIDLTDIDSEIDGYLAKFGNSAAKGASLVTTIQDVLNSNAGDK